MNKVCRTLLLNGADQHQEMKGAMNYHDEAKKLRSYSAFPENSDNNPLLLHWIKRNPN